MLYKISQIYIAADFICLLNTSQVDLGEDVSIRLERFYKDLTSSTKVSSSLTFRQGVRLHTFLARGIPLFGIVHVASNLTDYKPDTKATPPYPLMFFLL